MFKRIREFFKRYDLILCPTTIVAPFLVEQRYVTECNGHAFSTYIDWLAIVYAFTNVGSPAISIPAGFPGEKLPVGIQIAAPCRGEAHPWPGRSSWKICSALARSLRSIRGRGIDKQELSAMKIPTPS
jgi:Amidase